MASPTSKSQTTPLLPPTSSSGPDKPITPLTQGAINVLSLTRLIAGTACIIAPRFTAGLFQIPVSGQALILPRLFGVRDGVLAELLWTAEGTAKDRRELKRALWAGVATDSLDVASCAFGLATGTLSRSAAGLFGGGAAIFLALGIVGLRGV